MLTEQMQTGLEFREICHEFITKKPKSFNVAYEISHAMEFTRHTSDELKSTQSQVEVTNKIGYEKTICKNYINQQFRQHFKRQATIDESRAPNYYHQENNRTCAGCGEAHLCSQSRFFNARCNSCGKKGHIAKVCRSGARPRRTKQLSEEEEPTAQINNIENLSKVEIIGALSSLPKTLDVIIEGSTRWN